MTITITVTVELPDELAAQAQREGLLAPQRLQSLLEQALTQVHAQQQPATPAQQDLLARTRGLWRHGDGLAWQQRRHAEWERDAEQGSA